MQAPYAFQSPEEAVAYHARTGREFDLREPYRLPAKYLDGIAERVPAVAPTIVLINSNSGGGAGMQLTQALRRAIGQAQVCVPCFSTGSRVELPWSGLWICQVVQARSLHRR